MTDTIRENNAPSSGSHGQAPGRDVTVMDLWLVVRAYRRFALATILIVTGLGTALAFYMTPVHEFTTAIEIGNQVVNDEIIPIEASLTVIDKLQTGYVPLITSQFVQQNPDGPEEYIVEIKGSESSQIVQVLSEAPRDQRELITDLHGQVVQELVEDHNRTVDAMRANAEISLAEAEQKLGEMVAQDRALKNHLSSIGTSLEALENYTVELKQRIASAEAEIETLKQQCRDGDSCATQVLMLSNQIGSWRSVLVGVENYDKVETFVIRAEAEVKLENNAQEQKTAQNEIEFRTTNLENIQATRSLGQGTVMSIKAVAPNKPLIVAVALVIGLLASVAGALVLDFLKRAKQIEMAG